MQGSGNHAFFCHTTSLDRVVSPFILHRIMSRSLTTHSHAAFTLIELMVVIAIIAILAALTLNTVGYVNRKAAQSRAEAEVAAISAAIESYKLDMGAYPSNNTTTLFKELTGQGSTKKVYFEPTPNITTNPANGPFIDPWGAAYKYENPATYNVGFFDFYSTAGGTNAGSYIRN